MRDTCIVHQQIDMTTPCQRAFGDLWKGIEFGGFERKCDDGPGQGGSHCSQRRDSAARYDERPTRLRQRDCAPDSGQCSGDQGIFLIFHRPSRFF